MHAGKRGEVICQNSVRRKARHDFQGILFVSAWQLWHYRNFASFASQAPVGIFPQQMFRNDEMVRSRRGGSCCFVTRETLSLAQINMKYFDNISRSNVFHNVRTSCFQGSPYRQSYLFGAIRGHIPLRWCYLQMFDVTWDVQHACVCRVLLPEHVFHSLLGATSSRRLR